MDTGTVDPMKLGDLKHTTLTFNTGNERKSVFFECNDDECETCENADIDNEFELDTDEESDSNAITLDEVTDTEQPLSPY